MNKEFNELNKKSDLELCALLVKLNSQLLESRFKLAMGEVEKTHLIPVVRHTAAKCLYVLHTRGFKYSSGSHGVYLIDIKTNKIKDVTKQVAKLMTEENSKENKKSSKKSSQVKPDELVKKANNPKIEIAKTKPAKLATKPASKKEVK